MTSGLNATTTQARFTSLANMLAADLQPERIAWVHGVGRYDIYATDQGGGVELANGNWAQLASSGGGGTGDMTKAVYDPTSVNGDAFDMGNMVESATGKILTDAERDAITANTAKNSYPSADATKLAGIGDGAQVQSVVAGANVTVDNTDPQNPVVSGVYVPTNLLNYGAVGDGSTDNTSIIQSILDAGFKFIYVPDGVFNVTSIDYGFNVSFFGPGKIIPSSEFQTDQYGGLGRAGVKRGNTVPLDKHGGFIVGGEGPTEHGPMLKSQYNASMDMISSRESNPLEFQLYPNASTGIITGDGSGRIVFYSGFNGSLSNVKVDDVFWVGDTEYQVANVVNDTTIDLLNLPGLGAASIPVGQHSSSYLYITIDTTVDIVGSNITRVAGEAFQGWGSDHNVVIDGTRYTATVVDSDNATLSSPPGDTSNKEIEFRWLSDEKFVEILRFQRLLGMGTEETFSIAARPDGYKFRVGATGNGIGRQSPVWFEQKAPEDDPFPINDDPLSILTLHDNGKVGIHKRTPDAELHVKRLYNVDQGLDDTVKLLMRLEHEYQNGASTRRSLDFMAVNDFNAIRIQGKSSPELDDPSDIQMQTSGGKLIIGKPQDPPETVSIEMHNTMRLATLPVYADNAAAIAGGLGVGDMYRTSVGVLMVRF